MAWPDQPRNRLLSALPSAELDALRTCLEPISMKQRRVLHHDRAPMEHVYFVENGLVSVLAQIDERKAVEVWLIGREGLSGIPIVLGGSLSPHRRVVQLGGTALRMAAADVHAAMRDLPAFNGTMLRYVQLALVQTSQIGACNGAHTVRQRLARWLLTAQDRVGHDVLPLTHDMLARLLGVRRATITECTAMLDQERVISTRRGRLEIIDRDRLEAMSCLCYRIMANEHERMMRDLHGLRTPPSTICGHDHVDHAHADHTQVDHEHAGHRRADRHIDSASIVSAPTQRSATRPPRDAHRRGLDGAPPPAPDPSGPEPVRRSRL